MGIARPIVYGNRQIVHKAAVARIIKINETGHLSAVQKHIVFEQIGVDDAAGQVRVRIRHLMGDFIVQQFGIVGGQIAAQPTFCLRPPCVVARIVHFLPERAAGQVHFRQHRARVEALFFGGIRRVAARQFFHNARGFARQCGGERTVVLRNRCGACHAVCAQMVGQIHEKRQLFGTQRFKHGEHISARIGVQEKIAVGNALRNTLQRTESAQWVTCQQLAHFVVGNAGIYGHNRLPENSVRKAQS